MQKIQLKRLLYTWLGDILNSSLANVEAMNISTKRCEKTTRRVEEDEQQVVDAKRIVVVQADALATTADVTMWLMHLIIRLKSKTLTKLLKGNLIV